MVSVEGCQYVLGWKKGKGNSVLRYLWRLPHQIYAPRFATQKRWMASRRLRLLEGSRKGRRW
jgi:hypothetical protein